MSRSPRSWMAIVFNGIASGGERPPEAMPGGRWSRSTCRLHLVERDRFAFEAVEDHEPWLRHVLDRVLQPFATEPRSLYSAVRHMVDAVR